MRFSGDRDVTKENSHASIGYVLREQFQQYGQRYAGFVAQAAYVPSPGIEQRIFTSIHRQWVVATLVIPHTLRESSIRGGATGRLDPRVFVRRDRLRRELPPNPVGLLGDNAAPIQPRGREDRRHPSDSAACYQDIRGRLLHALPPSALSSGPGPHGDLGVLIGER